MTISHLDKLPEELESRHWVVTAEQTTLAESDALCWHICRPNGDTPLILDFTPGHGGEHGDVRLDGITESIACDIVNHPEIEHLYFGSKFSGKFQHDVVRFAGNIDAIDKNRST